MIDTIKIGHLPLRMPDPEDLRVRGWRKDYKRTGEVKSWIYKDKGNFPYLSVFTAPDGKVYLSAKVSLPAFLFGSNVHLPNQEEIKHGLEKLSDYVTKKSGLEFDAQTAIVWEVHFTKDFFVGECSMRQIITKLSTMSIPRFDKAQFNETTLYFHSKGRGKIENKPKTICIYDKHEERLNKSVSASEIQQSKGILRFEFRYRKIDVVKRLVENLSLPNREAQTIFTENVSSAVLAPIEKQILSLLEENASENPIDKLKNKFSGRRAATLISHLAHLYFYGDRYYKLQSSGVSESAYYKNQKDCRDAGVFALFNMPKNKIQVDDVPY